MIKLVEVKSRAELKQFIYLPKRIYKNYDSWVPPVFDDEWNFHDPRKNEAHRYARIVRFLATNKDVIVGRIMGIIHEKYNAAHEPVT